MWNDAREARQLERALGLRVELGWGRIAAQKIKEHEKIMHVECPHCSTSNKIEYAENILCSECEKSFSGYFFKKFKKPLISATTALIIGAVGAHKIEEVFFEDNRYPIKFEYEVINSCVNSSYRIMSNQRYVNKTNICICALDKTMQSISYKEYKKSESGFLTRLRANISNCT